jgi:hypothetical protein
MKFGKGDYWAPTNEIRLIRLGEFDETPGTVLVRRAGTAFDSARLEQKWVSANGEEEWIPVPVVERPVNEQETTSE